MSESEFQACLARIYVSESFRLLSRLDPSATIDRYELSPDERSAILALDHQRVDQFAASLRSKRRKRFETSFPAVFQIDRLRARRLWERFYELAGTISEIPVDATILAFGKFLEYSVENTGWPPYTRDLVAFETAVARAIPVSGDFVDLRNSSDIPQPHDRYALIGNAQLHTFHYDVIEILEGLAEGQMPDIAAEVTTHILIFRNPDSLAMRFFRLNESSMLVLKNCDGVQSVREIASKLEEHYNSPTLQPAIVKLVSNLHSRGIIQKKTTNLDTLAKAGSLKVAE